MSMFYVSGIKKPESIISALTTKGLPHVEASPNQWFVSYKGTSKELSDLLGITSNNDGSTGIVVAISGYYGRAPTNVWEFVAAHWDA